MTAIVLPDIDKATIDELRKKLPDLREIELPNLKPARCEGGQQDRRRDHRQAARPLEGARLAVGRRGARPRGRHRRPGRVLRVVAPPQLGDPQRAVDGRNHER